jgi:hypothetical protein
MSTRANVIVKDNHDQLWFYRHSDGYPEGTLPTLKKFMSWVVSSRVRDNVGQAAGWLILIGALEYNETVDKSDFSTKKLPATDAFEPKKGDCYGWKCGAYEPTTGQHGDIVFLYVCDLASKSIEVREVIDFYSCETKLIETISQF